MSDKSSAVCVRARVRVCMSVCLRVCANAWKQQHVSSEQTSSLTLAVAADRMPPAAFAQVSETPARDI